MEIDLTLKELEMYKKIKYEIKKEEFLEEQIKEILKKVKGELDEHKKIC